VADPLYLVVLTPSRTELEVDVVEWVHVELADGKTLTIWPGHLPMLGETVSAPLRYSDADGEHELELPPGLVQVEDRTVRLFLADVDVNQISETAEDSARFERLSEILMAELGSVGQEMG
jgi:F0F1-type ATP synthase epsilon subunit